MSSSAFVQSPHKRNAELHEVGSLFQSLLCAFGCNLKRCKRAGRRTKSMKINGKKPAKARSENQRFFVAWRKSANLFVLTQVSPVAEWNTPLRFFGAEGFEPGEGIAEDRRTRGSWRRSRSAGREGPTSGSPAIKSDGCTIRPSSFVPWVVGLPNVEVL